MTLTVTTRAFCLRNFSSTVIEGTPEPWLNTTPVPAMKDKNAYRHWLKAHDTDHPMFSMVEGEVPSLRIGSGNKPRRIHGVVADFDCVLTDVEVQAGLLRVAARFPVYAWNRTFSRGLRVVWRFDEPVHFYSKATFKRLIARVKREFKLSSVAPNLDDVIEDPEQYYVGGAGWTVVGGIVPAAAVHLWLAETSKDEDFNKEGIEIPIHIVAEEVERRYPHRWPGEFKVGARGVRFWDPTGDATSVIVRSTGVQAFTGDEPFLSWERLFGREFVQKYLESKLGQAIKEMFYDGKAYYRQLLAEERWDPMNTDTAKRHLRVRYGLSIETPKDGGPSEVDQALHRIEATKRVEGAVPFVHNHDKIVHYDGATYLNTSTVKVWTPSMDPQTWGETFPWIADHIDGLFVSPHQRDVFLSWLHVWFKQAYEGKPAKGHALYIVGPTGTGKTLLTTNIMSKLMGGSANASRFIVEGNKYNDKLCSVPLWTIDDALPGLDRAVHERYSAILKAAVANNAVTFEKKYGSAGDIPFNGRIAATLNNDARSMEALPSAELSLLDKFITLQTTRRQADVQGDRWHMEELIKSEMAGFARYVLDYQIPDSVPREPRFGIQAFHDPELLQVAQSTGPNAVTLETIDEWRKQYKEVNPDQDEWVGGVGQLISKLVNCEATHAVAKTFNPTRFGKIIKQAISEGTDWLDYVPRTSTSAQKVRISL